MKSKNIYFSIPSKVFPKITLANTVTIAPSYVHYHRTPTEYILYIITNGVMYLTEGDAEYTLVPGDIILLDPSRHHFGREASVCSYYYIHFQIPGIQEIPLTTQQYNERMIHNRMIEFTPDIDSTTEDEPILLPKYMHLDSAPFSQLENLAHEIQYSFHTPLELNYQMTCYMLMTFFINWQRTNTDSALLQNKDHMDALTLQIMAYLKIYYPEKVNSEKIEKDFYKSFDHVNRVFKKMTGITPSEYKKTQKL